MERKCSSLFTNSSSMRELKTRNSLASLHLRKEICHFEEEQKFLVKHMARDRVSQYEFLKEIRVCETNLNPHYHRLLEGRTSKDVLPNSLRKSRKNVQTAPPGCRTGSIGLTAGGSALVIPPRTAATALPHRMKSQLELVRHHRRDRPSKHEQAEEFLKQLREREVEDELLLRELSETNIENVLVKRIQDGLSRIPHPKLVTGVSCERWAGPREAAGFYSFSRQDNVSGSQPKVLESLFSERWTGPAESLFYSFTKSDNASGLLPKKVSIPKLEILTDDQDTEFEIKEQAFDLEVLSTMESSSKRIFKRKPVELRINEFLEKLEVLKNDQDKRLHEMPFWEKRRQWFALTRGMGKTFAAKE